MTDAPSATTTARGPAAGAAGPRVTIAGGGLAGLTAALRLAERGYQVKLYEQKSMLGGNLGSRPGPDGVDLDVYPHMYLNWYHNFWALMDSVGVDRAQAFNRFEAVKQLCQGEFPKFTALTDMYSPWHMLQNLFSGVGPVADMFVFGYASVDLLAERLNPTVHLRQMSVTAFLGARPYMTKRASAAYDSFITRVWAIPGYLASAHDFRSYLRFCLANPTCSPCRPSPCRPWSAPPPSRGSPAWFRQRRISPASPACAPSRYPSCICSSPASCRRCRRSPSVCSPPS
jgi:hypothetical protein